MRVDQSRDIGGHARDAAKLALLEGLEAHARAAEMLRKG